MKFLWKMNEITEFFISKQIFQIFTKVENSYIKVVVCLFVMKTMIDPQILGGILGISTVRENT